MPCKVPTFHSASYVWFLHGKGVETRLDIVLSETSEYMQPVLNSMPSARTGFSQKLVAYLAFDHQRTDEPRPARRPSEECKANKNFAFYYHALHKTRCWPVCMS